MSKYFKIGIYDRGDVIIGKENEDAFLNCTRKIALIKELIAEPLETCGFGMRIFPIEKINCDVKNIFTIDAWKRIIENNLLESINDKSIIQWLISQKRNIPEELLDYIKYIKPNDSIEGLLVYAETLQSAKWLYKNGASLEPKNCKYTVKEWWSIWRDEDHIEMFDYFFGENGITK